MHSSRIASAYSHTCVKLFDVLTSSSTCAARLSAFSAIWRAWSPTARGKAGVGYGTLGK
jgi:hypothetical protein